MVYERHHFPVFISKESWYPSYQEGVIVIKMLAYKYLSGQYHCTAGYELKWRELGWQNGQEEEGLEDYLIWLEGKF